MPWFPNQEHLVNHYSTAYGIMKPADTLESELYKIPFSNADLEASLSSMTDLKDDAGDFESLLDALPPSPEPQDTLDPGAVDTMRRKSTGSHGMSTARMFELCGFEPKTKNKSSERQGVLAVPIPQVTTDRSIGSNLVSLVGFMDSGMLEGSKPGRIMQVDGIDSCSDGHRG